MKTCLLIMIHGSRSREYSDEFQALLDELSSRGCYSMVRGCYLQFQEPDLEMAADELAAEGYDEVIVMPYFLFRGIHIQKDIPEILGRCSRAYPSVRFRLAPCLGYDPLLADIVLDRAALAQSFTSEE